MFGCAQSSNYEMVGGSMKFVRNSLVHVIEHVSISVPECKNDLIITIGCGQAIQRAHTL